MENQVIQIATDWWMFGSAIFAGLITALTTMAAVIYTNRKTVKQLKIQKDEHERERQKEYKLSKMVVLKPMLRLTTFLDILDEMVSSNSWERLLLLSGDDGFDFFDDETKLKSQRNRILKISNSSYIDVESIRVTTISILRNLNNDERLEYKAINNIRRLRGGEAMLIRILNQAQWEKIIELNKSRVPSDMDFNCSVEYSTLAGQRITYAYKINIKNDRRIEIIKDEIDHISDVNEVENFTPSIFRNLQDSISSIDRIDFHWEKVGKAQARGMISLVSSNSIQQYVNGSNEDAHANEAADKV